MMIGCCVARRWWWAISTPMGSTTGCLSAETASRGLGVYRMGWECQADPRRRAASAGGQWAVRAVGPGYGWRWRSRFGGARSDLGWGASAQEFAGEQLTAVQTPAAARPAQHQLGDAYPNPFNPAVVIPLDLATDAAGVSLTVYGRVGSSGCVRCGTGRWRRGRIGLCGMAATRRARRWGRWGVCLSGRSRWAGGSQKDDQAAVSGPSFELFDLNEDETA